MSRARKAVVVYLGAVAVMAAAAYVWADDIYTRRHR